jgi:hypothetical protein
MSELTQCNYCSLEAIKARAKRDKQAVTLMTGRPVFAGVPAGIDVFVHPRGINIRAVPNVPRQKYWVSWFMELSDHCVC